MENNTKISLQNATRLSRSAGCNDAEASIESLKSHCPEKFKTFKRRRTDDSGRRPSRNPEAECHQ